MFRMRKDGITMAFMDEEIIAKRNEAREKRKLSNEVIIEGVKYTFSRRMLFDETMSAILPDSFLNMNSEAAKFKYPSEQRPQVILCNTDGSISIAFNSTGMAVSDEELPELVKQMRAAIKRTNPANAFDKEVAFETESGRQVKAFDYISYALDTDVYNLFFACVLKGNLLIGTFNCPADSGKNWNPLVIQMLQSIQLEPAAADEEAR